MLLLIEIDGFTVLCLISEMDSTRTVFKESLKYLKIPLTAV